MEVSNGKNSERYAFLFNDIMLLTKKRRTSKYSVKVIFKLPQCILVGVSEGENNSKLQSEKNNNKK